jgi:hypothetical protein
MSLIRHERGGTMVLTLGLDHRPLAEEILAPQGGRAAKRALATLLAGCAIQRTAVLPLARPSRQGDHHFRRGAPPTDRPRRALSWNPGSSSAETRAPIVAAFRAHRWMSSLLSIATAAKTGQNFRLPLVGAFAMRSATRRMASAATGISRLPRARISSLRGRESPEGRRTCLTGRERKRKDNVRCLV